MATFLCETCDYLHPSNKIEKNENCIENKNIFLNFNALIIDIYSYERFCLDTVSDIIDFHITQ